MFHSFVVPLFNVRNFLSEEGEREEEGERRGEGEKGWRGTYRRWPAHGGGRRDAVAIRMMRRRGSVPGVGVRGIHDVLEGGGGDGGWCVVVRGHVRGVGGFERRRGSRWGRVGVGRGVRWLWGRSVVISREIKENCGTRGQGRARKERRGKNMRKGGEEWEGRGGKREE